MSMNDVDINPTQGADVYSGMRNPTTASTNADPKADNFVTDPTADDTGAGADPNRDPGAEAARGLKSAAGVVEARPGLIETSNIDPLNEHSNDDDGWANATVDPPTTTGTAISGISLPSMPSIPASLPTADDVSTAASQAADYASGLAATAASAATGLGKMAYGTATGDQSLADEGRKGVSDSTGY